jgi:flagellar basal-body rod protein FlgF
MSSSLYVGLSAQVALQKRLDSLANNVANAGTAGFRAEEIKFETLLSRAGADPVAFVTAGGSYLSRRAGEFVRTDNLLDVAVEGDAWIAFEGPGGPVYTRDGRMRMTDGGELQTLNGQPVLDAGGAPIRLEPTGGPPRIARDGTVSQGNRQIAAIGLFRIDERAALKRFETSGVVPDRPATPVIEFASAGLQQGFVERANVNPVLEMTRLIMLSRAFDAVATSIKDAEGAQSEAVKVLGATG